MSDITFVVASSMSALALSLLIAGRVAVEKMRTIVWGAMGVFGVHSFGVMITAPVSPRLTEMLANGTFVWLIAATLTLCARGLHRTIHGNQSALNVS